MSTFFEIRTRLLAPSLETTALELRLTEMGFNPRRDVTDSRIVIALKVIPADDRDYITGAWLTREFLEPGYRCGLEVSKIFGVLAVIAEENCMVPQKLVIKDFGNYKIVYSHDEAKNANKVVVTIRESGAFVTACAAASVAFRKFLQASRILQRAERIRKLAEKRSHLEGVLRLAEEIQFLAQEIAID